MTSYKVTITSTGLPEEVCLANLPKPPVGKNRKLIVQVARTNCAGAIWRIHDAINRYTEYTCRTITAGDTTNGRKFPSDILMSQTTQVRKVLEQADVVHFHNWIDYESLEMAPYRSILLRKEKVLQYHTEPSLLQRTYRRDVINRKDIQTLVIAQKHVRFYPHSIPVPNLVDIWNTMLSPVKLNNSHRRLLKVIFTPSDLKTYANYSNTCCGKGYAQTLAILKKLEAEGLIKFTLVTDKTWEELMPIKQQHDVCIDECVTGGYHLCSLEALSQGLVTIAWLDDQTKEAIKRIVGRETELPWINTHLDRLEVELRRLAAMRLDEIQVIKDRGRKWMEENWNPVVLVNHFLNAYKMKAGSPGQNVQQKQESGLYYRWEQKPALLSIYQIPGRLLPEALELRNAWKDNPVIVWGNGPTVMEALVLKDQQWFKNAKHIGTNAAVKISPDLRFDVYCIGDRRFLQIPEKFQIAMNAPGVKIYQSTLRTSLPINNISFVETIGREGICSDLTRGCFHGYSVAWFAIQVAFWTGAKDILLAGCGHDYSGPQPRFYPEKVPSETDNTLPYILHNYRNLMPILNNAGIRLRTIGRSKLAEAGVPQIVA